MTSVKSRRSNWALMKWFLIPDSKNPNVTYLKRLRVIQTPWFAFYLHWIYLPDDDRDPHDHPWKFTSLVLRGGYMERLYETRGRHTREVHARFSIHTMPLNKAHKITYIEPGTVTAVFTGRRRREWGFWTKDGFVEWTQYDRAGTGPDPFMS